MQLRILVCIMTLCVGHCECFALVSPLRCGNIRTTLHCTSECAGLRLSLEEDMNAGKRRAQPHVDRAQAIRTAAAAVLGGTGAAKIGRALPLVMRSGPAAPRSVASIDSWTALPVWPVWPTPDSPTGGRVRPISPNPVAADPFLLLAHHRHSFSPWDPLRAPFKAVGGALGLPYVGDEGFAIHPHRGIDIWTIVLDGSDGFKHKDSLGGECTYKGGSAQFMRSGSGAMHEEMWETRPDRATKIELFQLWVNLPARLKMNPPAIRYVGADWGAPYAEETQVDEATGVQTRVRTIGDSATLERATEGQGSVLEPRPSFKIQYARLPPGGSWIAPAQPAHTALCYVARGGSVQVNGEESGDVPTGSTCIFAGDGDSIWLVNQGKDDSEVLVLTGEPLREPIALGGPIVMNTERELQEAYAELRAGTFIKGRTMPGGKIS